MVWSVFLFDVCRSYFTSVRLYLSQCGSDKAMASASQKDSAEHMATLCAQVGLHHLVITLLDQNGYTTPSLLAHALPREDSVEMFVDAIFQKTGLMQQIAPNFVLPWSSHPEVSRFRSLWMECWQVCSSHSKATTPSPAPGGLSLEPQVASWLDLPPPKLSPNDVETLENHFSRRYPGERLTPAVSPGHRYLSTIHKMLSPDNVFEWMPWTKIMSVEQEKSYKDKVKPEDSPAPELSAIFGRLLTHNPHLDEADLSTAPFRLSRMFQVRRNAFAMCGLAHLANIKILDDKMLDFMTVRHSAESGLRNPTLAELKEADRHVWEEMARLVSRFAFKWDDVLFEFAEVRADLSNRLGQRLKPPTKGTGKALPAPLPSGTRQHRGRSRSHRARRSRSNSRHRNRQGDRGRGDRDRGNRGADRVSDRGSDRTGSRRSASLSDHDLHSSSPLSRRQGGRLASLAGSSRSSSGSPPRLAAGGRRSPSSGRRPGGRALGPDSICPAAPLVLPLSGDIGLLRY